MPLSPKEIDLILKLRPKNDRPCCPEEERTCIADGSQSWIEENVIPVFSIKANCMTHKQPSILMMGTDAKRVHEAYAENFNVRYNGFIVIRWYPGMYN